MVRARATPRVIGLPSKGIGYIDGFYAAARAQGIEVLDGEFSGGWLWQNVRRGDIVHLHWPSFSYESSPGKADVLAPFARFVALLLLARARGARIVWTAHNLLPHRASAIPALDRLGRRIVLRLASRVAVHGPSAAALLRSTFPYAREKEVLIPHGHFADQYPAGADRTAARERLHVPADARVALFLGLCAPYKNLHALIDAFVRTRPADHLLIAGRFDSAEYEQRCRALAAGSPRVHIHAGYVDDAALQFFLRAADVFVVPYREILTSGSAVLAASFGLPVVSIDKGFLHDFIEPHMGVLFPADRPDLLADALGEGLETTWDHERIAESARRHTFDEAVRRIMAAL